MSPERHAAGRSATILLSGGLDSALCAYRLKEAGYETSGLFVDYGQGVARRELEAAGMVAASLGIPFETRTVRGGRSRGGGEHIGRNAMLVSEAAFASGLVEGVIAIGIHAGVPYYDCSPAFLDSMGRVVAEQSDGLVRLVAPLLAWSKAEIFDAFRASGLPLEATFSCEVSPQPCGRCASCLDRLAFGC